MKDLGICVEKDCDKPRFLEYYVCAEHFVFYAAPRYTESMLVNAEPVCPATYPSVRLCPEESPHNNNGGQQESPPPEPAEREATKRARIF